MKFNVNLLCAVGVSLCSVSAGAQSFVTSPNLDSGSMSPPAVTSAQTEAASVAKPDVSVPKNQAYPTVMDGLITEVGTGKAVTEGSRVLRAPSKCTPKANSLDCTSDDKQTQSGADVSSRVRNSVIGEVGSGRAATEGGGAAKRQQACVPLPGKLTCE